MSLEKDMDTLAKQLGDRAAAKEVPLIEAVDAFKALTAYYAARQKHAKKAEPEDDDSFSFAQPQEIPNGRHSKVRAS